MKNIFFVNTRYQLEVSLDVAEFEGLDKCVYVVPSELHEEMVRYCPPEFDFIFIDNLNVTKGFFESRRLLRQMKRKLKELPEQVGGIWLANDDHILGQFLINYLGVKDIYLFEDGLGSYIRYKPMMLDYGVVGFLSVIKRILYFAPYYLSWHRFGGNVQAVKCYSYNEFCFPRQESSEKVLVKKKMRGSHVFNKSISSRSVIVIGQPLVEYGVMTRGEYRDSLCAAMAQVFPDSKVFYKPHPRESDFSKLPENMAVLDKDVGAEFEIMACGSDVYVCGFFSTVLLNCVALDNVKRVVALRVGKLRASEDYYNVLQKVGCEVVDL